MPSNGSDAGSTVSSAAAQILTLLIARWRVAVGVPLAAALVVVVTALVWPASYQSAETFLNSGLARFQMLGIVANKDASK